MASPPNVDLPTKKQANEKSYYQRLEEERDRNKQLIAAFTQHKLKHKELNETYHSLVTQHTTLLNEYEQFKQQSQFILQQEKDKHRQAANELLLTLKADNEIQIKEMESRTLRLMDAEKVEEKRRIMEEVNAKLARSHKEDLESMKKHYDTQIYHHKQNMEQLTQQIYHLLQTQNLLEQNLRKERAQRQIMLVRLQICGSGFAHMRDYRTILKYLLVITYVRRYSIMKAAFAFHQQMIDLMKICRKHEIGISLASSNSNASSTGSSTSSTSGNTGTSSGISDLLALDTYSTSVLSPRNTVDAKSTETECASWIDTATRIQSKKVFFASRSTDFALFQHLSDIVGIIPQLLIQQSERIKQAIKIQKHLIQRITELTATSVKNQEQLSAAQQQLQHIQQKLHTLSTEKEAAQSRVQELQQELCNQQPHIDRGLLKRVDTQEQMIFQLRDQLLMMNREKQKMEERMVSLLEIVDEKKGRVWYEKELEKGWHCDWRGGQRAYAAVHTTTSTSTSSTSSSSTATVAATPRGGQGGADKMNEMKKKLQKMNIEGEGEDEAGIIQADSGISPSHAGDQSSRRAAPTALAGLPSPRRTVLASSTSSPVSPKGKQTPSALLSPMTAIYSKSNVKSPRASRRATAQAKIHITLDSLKTTQTDKDTSHSTREKKTTEEEKTNQPESTHNTDSSASGNTYVLNSNNNNSSNKNNNISAKPPPTIAAVSPLSPSSSSLKFPALTSPKSPHAYHHHSPPLQSSTPRAKRVG